MVNEVVEGAGRLLGSWNWLASCEAKSGTWADLEAAFRSKEEQERPSRALICSFSLCGGSISADTERRRQEGEA